MSLTQRCVGWLLEASLILFSIKDITQSETQKIAQHVMTNLRISASFESMKNAIKTPILSWIKEWLRTKRMKNIEE